MDGGMRTGLFTGVGAIGDEKRHETACD